MMLSALIVGFAGHTIAAVPTGLDSEHPRVVVRCLAHRPQIRTSSLRFAVGRCGLARPHVSLIASSCAGTGRPGRASPASRCAAAAGAILSSLMTTWCCAFFLTRVLLSAAALLLPAGSG